MVIKASARYATVLAVAGLCALAWAEKTDQQVVQQFSTLLGGKYARIVWMKGGSNSGVGAWNNLEVPGEPVQTSIYVCDTRDGVRRPLSTKLPSGHLTNPAITADGRTVVFCVGGSGEVWVSDWEGTNPHKIASPYISFRTWRDPTDGTDWVVALGQADGSAYRINLNTPTSKVLLYSGLPDGNLCYSSLSKDGVYLTGGFPEYGTLGISRVPSGAINRSIFNPNGCWPDFSKVNNGKILYTIDPHVEIKIIDINGTKLMQKNIFGGGAPGPAYNALRWTNDEDYISYWPYSDPGGGSPKMPVVLRVSTLAWASLYDNATDVNANTDVCIYTGGIAIIGKPLVSYRATRAVDYAPTIFSINGAVRVGQGPSVHVDAAPGTVPRLVLSIGNAGN